MILLLVSCGCDSVFSTARPFLGWSPRRPSNTLQPEDSRIDFETRYFRQPVDHFGFANSDEFKQRYLVVDKFWNKNGGPVFFYTGNEGDIVWFMKNTGIMFEWAPEFNAMLVFAEHRYYGETLPYGNDSYKDPQHLGYLTSEQALADFVALIDHIKHNVSGAAFSPVVAFGGSYGGMLSAWLRIKYPHSIVGALAASAPIWNFEDLVPCGGFMSVVTRDFEETGSNCATNVRRSWDVILKTAKSSEGLSQLTDIFHLCKPLTDGNSLVNWISTAWVYMAMVDYPYPADFLVPLPGWPIKATCNYLKGSNLTDVQLLHAIKDAVGVYYNYTGDTKCFSLDENVTPSLGDKGWDFQACTEMIMPMCADGMHDMFLPSPWNLSAVMTSCSTTYGVTPRPSWIVELYGGKNIETASNIIFSNGKLDPWSAGGVLKSLSPTLIAIVIEEGAHHLDLRTPTPLDPQSVIDARVLEREIIQQWIQEYMHTSAEMKEITEPSVKVPCQRENAINEDCADHRLEIILGDKQSLTLDSKLLFICTLILLLLVLVFLLGHTAHRRGVIAPSGVFEYASVDKLSSS